VKLATATATATVEEPLRVVDLETNRSAPAQYLEANDIGTAVMRMDRLIAVDRYTDSRDTGSFILIDPETGDTLALGIVEAVKPLPAARGVKGILLRLIRSTETHARSIVKAISWRTAGSLDTFVIATLITGSSKVAGGVALTEVLTKCALYYAHERVWSLIPWGRR
jgi:uncharacterized membrane protein